MRTRSRRAKLSLTKSGGKRGGSSIFRATLPTSWIREMGLSENVRNIKLLFDGEQIVIKNNEEEIKMLEKLLEIAREKIKEEMARDAGYIDDSDLTDRFLDNLAYELTMNNEKIDQDELLQAIKDEIMIEYNKIGSVNDAGDYTGCYYKDKKGLVAWCLTWLPGEAMSLEEEYKWFMDEFGDIEITLKEYARLARDIEPGELEDYL